MNTPVKDYHVYLCALNACYLVWSVLYPLLLRHSSDEGIYYGHFWGRIIVSHRLCHHIALNVVCFDQLVNALI